MCQCDYVTQITSMYNRRDTFTLFSHIIVALYIPELLLALGLIPVEGTVVCSKENLTELGVHCHPLVLPL